MIKKLLSGICAGILISIGGAVFLNCENKYVGAVLFSVALFCICAKGYSLYTGKIGNLLAEHDKEYFSALLLGLLGNLIGTFACGYALRYAVPSQAEAAEILCMAKLEQQSLPQTLIRAIFCGILVYLAVSIYKEKNTALGILLGIPAFILSGFEHSIADMFYFSASGIVSWQAYGFIWMVILGNSIGALILPLLNYTRKKANKKQEDIK